MSTNTPRNHFDYTINEYNEYPLKQVVDIITQDPSINTIYDIGANSGATATIFGKSPYVNRVYCFEPDLENFKFMSDLLETNPKYVLIPKGVYYGKTEMDVYLPLLPDSEEIYQTCGGYSVDPSQINNTNIYRKCGKTFQLCTLEEHNFASPNFVKMDVEGSECNILKHSSLIQHAKYLFIETHHLKNFEMFKKRYLPNFTTILDLGSDQLLQAK